MHCWPDPWQQIDFLSLKLQKPLSKLPFFTSLSVFECKCVSSDQSGPPKVKVCYMIAISWWPILSQPHFASDKSKIVRFATQAVHYKHNTGGPCTLMIYSKSTWITNTIPLFCSYFTRWLCPHHSLFSWQHCSLTPSPTALLRMCTVSHPLPLHAHPALTIQSTVPHSLSMHKKLKCISPQTPI